MKTVGERIRYFRKSSHITQDRLAELTGIHPVSIRKYEINKMQPQLEQIERIASVLDVNSAAIVGYNSKPSILRTVGDLTGIIMTLFKTHVLMIVGKPHFSDEDLDTDGFDPLEGLDPQQMVFMINPALHGFFDVAKITNFSAGEFTTGKLSLAQLGVVLKDPEYAENLVQWAFIYTLCERLLHRNKDEGEQDPAMGFMMDRMEELELVLLANTEPLQGDSFGDDSEALFLRFSE